MGRIVDKELWHHIHTYFTIYLPQARGCSKHTIRAYQKSLTGFLEFVAQKHGMALTEMTFSRLTGEALLLYLEHLEKMGASISTRNHRRNGIRAFCGYVANVDATKMVLKTEIDQVPLKKTAKEKVEYLSEKAVKILLEQPNVRTKKGLRDRLIMLLMYDTAARVSGIVNLSVCDIAFGKNTVVTLHEKGGKINTVPIMKQTVAHIQQYLAIFHPDETGYGKSPLFYTEHNYEKCKLDTSTINKFMKHYGVQGRRICPEIPANMHPHLLRHSRAMHLYQHGMDLTLVSQWLGHSRLETTLIYAHADTEQKRKAIEEATSPTSPLYQKQSTKRFTVTDDETLKRLYGLL